MINAVSQLGILMLLLLTGMETDLKLVRKVGLPAIAVTAAGVAVPFACGFSAGFFLAILAAILIAFLIKRTALGFEIRAVGQGADAARASGISVGKTIVNAMIISGALAGLAGAVEVLGVHHHYYDQFSPGYGFDSIAVALLGGLTSSGVTMSAILFGGLNSGAIQMELGDQQTPRQIAGIVQAIVIIAVGVKYLRHRGGK